MALAWNGRLANTYDGVCGDLAVSRWVVVRVRTTITWRLGSVIITPAPRHRSPSPATMGLCAPAGALGA